MVQKEWKAVKTAKKPKEVKRVENFLNERKICTEKYQSWESRNQNDAKKCDKEENRSKAMQVEGKRVQNMQTGMSKNEYETSRRKSERIRKYF